MKATLVSFSKWVFSNVLEGMALKFFLGTSPQTLIFHVLLFYTTPNLCNAIVGLHASMSRGDRAYDLPQEASMPQQG